MSSLAMQGTSGIVVRELCAGDRSHRLRRRQQLWPNAGASRIAFAQDGVGHIHKRVLHAISLVALFRERRQASLVELAQQHLIPRFQIQTRHACAVHSIVFRCSAISSGIASERFRHHGP